jgi:FMN phosphatase YigB (HAD superfamily)
MTDQATLTGHLTALTAGVKLLCLDAGNTVIFLDHARLARLVTAAGFTTNADALLRAEGRAKARAETFTLIEPSAFASAEFDQAAPSVRSWARMVSTILVEAGHTGENLGALMHALWGEHVQQNLWSLVPKELPQALRNARARGFQIIIVSNSEGMLAALFQQLGIFDCFDRILDSGIIGIEKPDPRIFRMALDYVGAAKTEALHLGDVYATDVLGARAAGIRVGLIDPYGHYTGRHADVPRVASAAEVAEMLR